MYWRRNSNKRSPAHMDGDELQPAATSFGSLREVIMKITTSLTNPGWKVGTSDKHMHAGIAISGITAEVLAQTSSGRSELIESGLGVVTTLVDPGATMVYDGATSELQGWRTCCMGKFNRNGVPRLGQRLYECEMPSRANNVWDSGTRSGTDFQTQSTSGSLQSPPGTPWESHFAYLAWTEFRRDGRIWALWGRKAPSEETSLWDHSGM
ncbi:uncharacterized protein EV422DRAFT_509375 [Fimicolochytrium jonesii]|uniref:uncharacterized protein n=1 Tax=Fimicolochytrium jonesii TaxID=1396493 RepID=UPI0022FF1319|nr:uncharacterized protein EV422DRAFT_509375 [Fimicolochytrium jonesii]KAI8816942.1 hypothetical protein EV422DRAFT_509375 [Fimicolochytrium jonesii]